MNCPMHCLIFRSRGRSYRELPLRLFEFGTVYRYELSGVVHGLTRVRGLTMDDAHIYCTRDQMRDELTSLLRFVLDLLGDYGLTDFYLELSTKDPNKFVGSDEMWEEATSVLAEVGAASGLDLVPDPGGAAFYGPKISVQVTDALGRSWQMSTIQLDFNFPERFELEYTAADGSRQRPVMIHRALFGSIERFFAILTEHYAGAFPAWLAPVQAVAIPVTGEQVPFVEGVAAALRAQGIRVEVDGGDDRMQKKIRTHTLQKVPFLLLAGARDAEAGAVSFRFRDGSQLNGVPVESAVATLVDWVRRRSRWMRRRTAPGKRGGALRSPLGCPASTGRNERCSSRRSMPIPVNRSCSTATAESTWWTPSPPAVPVALPIASASADTSTAATDDPARMPTWQPVTSGCWCCHHSAAGHEHRWSGACILQRRSTSYEHAAARSRRSSRIATPSTCSAQTRWIRRCVRPPLGLVTPKAEPSPSSSPDSGDDTMNAPTPITITPVRVADLLAGDERMPVYVHVIDHPDARVLVDTGMTELHPAVADLDPRLRPLSEQDFDLAGIDIVVNTHLHFDHCGGNHLFAGRPIYVQRRELDDARSEDDYTIREWVEAPGVRYVPVDGELELLPGLRLVPAPGHTRGMQVVVVETGGRPVVVGGDVAVWFGELDEPHTEGQLRVRALDPELVWLAHEHEPWRPRTV